MIHGAWAGAALRLTAALLAAAVPAGSPAPNRTEPLFRCVADRCLPTEPGGPRPGLPRAECEEGCFADAARYACDLARWACVPMPAVRAAMIVWPHPRAAHPLRMANDGFMIDEVH
jgi:hypothetical protein